MKQSFVSYFRRTNPLENLKGLVSTCFTYSLQITYNKNETSSFNHAINKTIMR